MSEVLEVARSGRVLQLRLNRAEKRNALSAELCLALVRTITEADASLEVGAIVLSANGPAFCAGMDIAEIRPGHTEDVNLAHEQLFTIGMRISTPLICAVGGAALGGGVGLVANCHIAIASARAAFGLTEIRLGLWPFLVFRAVVAAVGERRALEMALTGRTLGAIEAKSFGLVHEIVADPDEQAMAIAEGIAASSPTAVRNGMSYVREARDSSWSEAGEIARRVRDEIFQSADFREGVAAFREKRSPKWPSLE